VGCNINVGHIQTNMELEAEIAKYVQFFENFEPLTVDELRDSNRYRARYRRMIQSIEPDPPAEVTILDDAVDSPDGVIPVRIYRRGTADRAPCCLFFHGGGWVLGDLDTHQTWAADLCVRSGATVIATDYRLGPENAYPAAFNDCYAVLEAVAADGERFGVDADRIAVYGDSAGGNLAAALCLKARDAHGPVVAGQVLVYPALHYGDALPSWYLNRDAPILNLDALHSCWRAYLGGAEADCYAAPLLATDFSRLPSTWIVTAEHDPLRDDGLLYAERLADAEVDVEVLDGEGLVHGCFRARHTSELTREAFAWSVQSLRFALSIYS
jgi:acetyl esterase